MRGIVGDMGILPMRKLQAWAGCPCHGYGSCYSDSESPVGGASGLGSFDDGGVGTTDFGGDCGVDGLGVGGAS
jgi:hypothetical protein